MPLQMKKWHACRYPATAYTLPALPYATPAIDNHDTSAESDVRSCRYTSFLNAHNAAIIHICGATRCRSAKMSRETREMPEGAEMRMRRAGRYGVKMRRRR